MQYQKLIISHLSEKTHRGVLTGAPITDMKITLLVGKAHLKHTEGGDFRQATYRAVRQGLMQAKSVLLEPWYDFVLTCPAEQIGRGITDIRAMGGEFDPPESSGSVSVLKGLVPASEVKDYAETVAAYTQGRGRLQLSLHGYAPCHNTEEVVAEIGYDPEADVENTPDSVFCAHGAGFNVKWDEVKNHMHLESGLREEKAPQIITRNVRYDDKELEKIMEREFGPIRRPLYNAKASNRPATEEISIKPPKQKYMIVDGYNIIFAWEELKTIARDNLDAARKLLMDLLSNYQGYKKNRVILVFDAYKVPGGTGEVTRYHNIHVVYTKEAQTADAYIEKATYDMRKQYRVRVATSDGMEQLIILGHGATRVPANIFRAEVQNTHTEIQDIVQKYRFRALKGSTIREMTNKK